MHAGSADPADHFTAPRGSGESHGTYLDDQPPDAAKRKTSAELSSPGQHPLRNTPCPNIPLSHTLTRHTQQKFPIKTVRKPLIASDRNKDWDKALLADRISQGWKEPGASGDSWLWVMYTRETRWQQSCSFCFGFFFSTSPNTQFSLIITFALTPMFEGFVHIPVGYKTN